MAELTLDTNTTTSKLEPYVSRVNSQTSAIELVADYNLRRTSSFVTLFVRTILNEVKDIVLRKLSAH